MGWRQAIFVSCGTVFFICGLSLGAPLNRKESLDNIDSLKTKLEGLKSVLRGLENDLSAKEARQEDTSQDELLQQYESQLSQADQQLVEKMKSKVKYLQQALHEPAHPDENDQEAVQQEKRGHAAVNDVELRELLARLSPQDARLIKAHPSKLDALKTALQKETDIKAKQPKEPTLRDKEVEILEAIKSKLTELRNSLAKDERCRTDPLCDTTMKTVITEGKFGDFVAVDHNNNVAKEADTNGSWMQAPVDDTGAIDLNEKCQDGENCHKPPEDHQEKKCEDENCHKPPQDHQEMVDSVKQMLLKDLAMAEKNGVSTKELLDALEAKRQRRLIDDREQAKVEFEEQANHVFM